MRSSISAACPHTPSKSCARENTRPGFSKIFEQPELGRAEMDVAHAAPDPPLGPRKT